MMNSKKYFVLGAVLLVLALVIAACGTPTPPQPPQFHRRQPP